MAHNLGTFFKYLAAAIIFAFSLTLGYSFFSAIAPVDKPWLSWTALGLTEVGLILWLAVFVLTRHQNAHKVLALIMIFVCLIAVLVTDCAELAILFSAHGLLRENAWITTVVYYVLIVLFAAHLLAFVSGFLIDYFHRYPFFEYHRGNLIPTTNGNLLPSNVSVQELQELQAGNESGVAANPLAAIAEPKPVSLAQMATMGKEAVNSATRKAKHSTKNTLKRVSRRGKANATTEENGLTEE